MKGFKWLALCIIVLLTSVTVNAVAQREEPRELTFAQAVEEAISSNLDFELAHLGLEQAEAGLRRAEIVGDQKMLTDAQEALTVAKLAYEDTKQQLVTKVQNTYQEILQNSVALDRQLAAAERAAEQLKIDQSKYAAGLLSSLDIMRAEISLQNAQNNYATAKENLETIKLRFNELLGLPLDTVVILTEHPMLSFVPFEFTLEECYTLALEADQAVQGSMKKIEDAEEAIVVAQSPFTPQVQLEQALTAKREAEIALKQAENTLYFRIRTEYLNVNRGASNVQIKENEVGLEKRILQAEESKYAAGVVSNAQIVTQQEKLATVEQEYSKALLDYSLGRSNLLQLIGRPEIIWGDQDARGD